MRCNNRIIFVYKSVAYLEFVYIRELEIKYFARNEILRIIIYSFKEMDLIISLVYQVL